MLCVPWDASEPTTWLAEGTTMARTHLLGRVVPLVLATALALVGVLAGVVVAGPAEARARPRLAPLSVFTLNVDYALSTAEAEADAARAMSMGSVGGFQEFSGLRHRKALADAVAAHGWQMYMPAGAGVTTPIVWDADRFSLISSSSTLDHPAQEGVTPARYVNAVRLRDRTSGNVLGFVNTHTIARASYDARPTDPTRVPRLRRHLAMLRSVISSTFATTENVVAVGDLNINYLADRRRRVAGFPTRALGDLVDFDMPLRGSRGPTSLLDYVMTVRDAAGLAPRRSRIVRGFHSDHDAVVASFQPVRLLADRVLHNDPAGERSRRRLVVDRLVRAVLDAEPGSQVRVASGRVVSAPMLAALTAARARGVEVTVKTSTELVEGSLVMVSRAGGTRDVALVASRWLTPALVNRPARLRITSQATRYRVLGRWFDRL